MGWLRHPKTTQERRRWFSDIELIEENPELKLRAKRAPHRLPTVYDDIFPKAWRNRSWKRHRATQYGVVRAYKPKSKGTRGTFDTPNVEMSCYPHRIMGLRWFGCYGRGEIDKFPFRVRFKYIKNKTA